MPNILETLAIKTPCQENWQTMPGDDRKRFCGQCQLYVHNLTEYSKEEATDLIQSARQEGKPACVRFYRDNRGQVVTNNCPVYLRKYQKRLLAIKTAAVLFLVARGLVSQALAQGLVGAPVDPRYGQGGEVGVPMDENLTILNNAWQNPASSPITVAISIAVATYSALRLGSTLSPAIILNTMLLAGSSFLCALFLTDLINARFDWQIVSFSAHYFLYKLTSGWASPEQLGLACLASLFTASSYLVLHISCKTKT